MSSIKERFEEALLDGKSPDNILASSQLHLGADGEYFNSNTRALFKFYRQGWEDHAATAEESSKPVPCATGHLPIGWPGTGGTYCEVCSIKLSDEQPAACNWSEPEPGCSACDGKGDNAGNPCKHCWELPF